MYVFFDFTYFMVVGITIYPTFCFPAKTPSIHKPYETIETLVIEESLNARWMKGQGGGLAAEQTCRF